MNVSQLSEARALLALFLRSTWTSCHVKTASIEFFVTRQAAGAVPVQGTSPVAIKLPDEVGAIVALLAPHVGSVLELAPVGNRILAGGSYGAIEVLDSRIDLLVDRNGVIVRHLRAKQDLVEFEQPLAEFRCDPPTPSRPRDETSAAA